MKNVYSFLVILVLGIGTSTYGADVVPNNCVEEQVLDLFTKWRNGNISSPLPSLEVIRIKSVEGLYEGFGIKITYVTGDMQLTGANNFTVEELFVSANDLQASTTIRFPLLTLSADKYSLKGRAYLMYSLKGTGLMKATFQNVEVTLGTTLVPKGKALQVDDVNLNFSVDNIKVNLEDSSWPINKVLNSSAMKIVETHRSELVTATKNMLKHVINEYLATMTSSQLLSIAGNNYCTGLSSF